VLRPRTRFPVALAALALFLATPAFAELWYENYQKGEEALQAKRWTEAIARFSKALEEKSDPGVNVRTYGMNFINYHPYLKLGIAYLNLGQQEAALQAFETEEKMGAIARSPEAKDLARYREQAQAAQNAHQAEEQKKTQDLVAKSLEEAGALEGKGDLDGALTALGKALALARDDPAVTAAMKRLQDKVAAEQAQRGLKSRVADAVREAKEDLAASRFQEASSALNQALALDPINAEVKSLLEDSQSRLRAQIQATHDAESRRAMVTKGIEDAAGLEKTGQFDQALRQLQSVLALEPTNPQALAAQARLAKAQAEAQGKATLLGEIAPLLQQGEDLFKERKFDLAVARLLRVLALDPANGAALALLPKVHAERARTLIGGDSPPVITLNDFRTAAGPDGRREQPVSEPEFVLSGTVLHTRPVTVTFQDGSGAVIGKSTLDKTRLGNLYLNPFQQSLTLSPGVTTLKIQVQDDSGLSSQEEYQVRYLRPWSRSPWFYSLLAAVPVAAAAGYTGYRIRRKSALLRRRFNPYVAGSPVLNNDMFLGREALLSRILQTIHNNSILLYGERRIGKTSLQHHLKKRLQQIQDPEFTFHPVYIDLQGTPQERFFSTMADDIFQELGPMLAAAGVTRSAPSGDSYDYMAFVRDVHEVVKVLRKQNTKKAKLVLLIDEVDELNNYDPRVNQKLRSLFMKSFAEDMVAVVSGVGIKKHWASEGSPWYNFFEEIEVKPFTRKDAQDLIERPIRGVFTLEAGAIDRILEHSNCKPYLIQKLCIALVNRMHDEKRSKITVSDVDAIGRPAEG
jgi:hypothetical protein